MFERNKVDTTTQQHAIAVEVTLSDQRILNGNLSIPMSKSLADLLNGATCFVEFEPFGGEPQLIAKNCLHAIRKIDIPAQRTLRASPAGGDRFDPHEVLGLPKGAAADELRTAFHNLSLTYHPDRYAAAELPAEVREYLQSMARRINTAYAMLQEEQARSKRISAMRTEAVYQSRRPA